MTTKIKGYIFYLIFGLLMAITGNFGARGMYNHYYPHIRVAGIILVVLMSIIILIELIKSRSNGRSEIISSKKEIDEILNHQRLDEFDKVFQYIDTLVRFKKYKDAIPYLDAALMHYPLKFDYQLLYIKCLKKIKNHRKVKEVAKFICSNAEDGCYVEQAARLIGMTTVAEFPKLDNSLKDSPYICLVPICDYDRWLMLKLKNILNKLTVDVVIEDAKLSLKSVTRESEETVLQWNAEKIYECFSEKVKNDKNITYILVTSDDLYVEGKDYVFDYLKGGTAIVSYCRFKASFNDGIPSQQRVLCHTAAMCLSAISKIFEVEISCSDDTCLCCSHFSSVKNSVICSSCINKLNSAIKK